MSRVSRSRRLAPLIALVLAGCGGVPLPSWMPFEARRRPPTSAGSTSAAEPAALVPPQGMVFRHHLHWIKVPPLVPKGGRQALQRGHVTLWGAVPSALGGSPGLVPVRIVLGDPRGAHRELAIADPVVRWEAGELRLFFMLDGAVSADLLPDDPFTCDQFTAEPERRARWPIDLTFARAEGGMLTLHGEVEEADLQASDAAQAYLAAPAR